LSALVWTRISALAQAPVQPPAERPFKIVTLDPALNSIVAPDAKLETLGSGFGLTEGPVWVQQGREGYLLFSDNAANRIYKWSEFPQPGSTQPGSQKPGFSVFLQKSGYTGNNPMNVGSQTTTGGGVAIVLIGSNGLTLDSQGRLLITAMNDRSVVRLEKDGARTVLADRYQGKRFNGPNDIAIRSDGAVYFTDTVFGLRGAGDSPDREIPYSGFFLIKDGKITLLGGDDHNPGYAPNGIALSPDEKHLYVTAGGNKTMRYDVLPDGTVANPIQFLDGGNDGIKVDQNGNVYSIVRDEVWITSPQGKRLGTLQLPQIAKEPRPRIVGTNLAFGDADGKTLYITACTHVFRIRMRIPGVRPGPKG
jgi:gluconolactonase